jgi:hypothetical protein
MISNVNILNEIEVFKELQGLGLANNRICDL